MTRQKKEDPVVLQGRRKAAVTRGDERPGGGRGAPVNQQAQPLELSLGTAEHPNAQAKGAVGAAEASLSGSATHAVPKPRVMESICFHQLVLDCSWRPALIFPPCPARAESRLV